MNGVLIAFEGIYSSGKTTQIEILSRWLNKYGVDSYISSWNSSALMADQMLRWRIEGRLRGDVLAFLELADFSERWAKNIDRRLKEGAVVLCDRYIYTAFARGNVRSGRFEPDTVSNVVANFRVPDRVFYFQTLPTTSLARRTRTGRTIEGYVSGSDFLATGSLEGNYIQYQTLLNTEYERLIPEAFLINSVDSVNAIAETIRLEVSTLISGDKDWEI